MDAVSSMRVVYDMKVLMYNRAGVMQKERL